MEIKIAVAKTNQYTSSESGDTLEVIERPNGGVSVVLANAHTPDNNPKFISSMVVRKVISLLAEGIRDSTAARAASDYLFTEKNGKITAFLNILSADLQTGTLVISRNATPPVYIARGDRIEILSGDALPIGFSREIRPVVTEVPIEPGLTVVMFTEGLTRARGHFKQTLDVRTHIEAMLEEQEPSPQEIADTLLTEAIRMDHACPTADMSIVVLRVMAHHKDQIRRMSIDMPVDLTA